MPGMVDRPGVSTPTPGNSCSSLSIRGSSTVLFFLSTSLFILLARWPTGGPTGTEELSPLDSGVAEDLARWPTEVSPVDPGVSKDLARWPTGGPNGAAEAGTMARYPWPSLAIKCFVSRRKAITLVEVLSLPLRPGVASAAVSWPRVIPGRSQMSLYALSMVSLLIVRPYVCAPTLPRGRAGGTTPAKETQRWYSILRARMRRSYSSAIE